MFNEPECKYKAPLEMEPNYYAGYPRVSIS